LLVDCLVYVMQVGGLATQTDTIIDDLTVDFFFGCIY